MPLDDVSPEPVLTRLAKVLGSSVIQRARGSQITLRSETSLSSCSTTSVEDGLASFSWGLLAVNESRGAFREIAVEADRDPRVLGIPPYTLGFAGSSYVFQFRSTLGSDMSTTANATGELSEMESRITCLVGGGWR